MVPDVKAGSKPERVQHAATSDTFLRRGDCVATQGIGSSLGAQIRCPDGSDSRTSLCYASHAPFSFYAWNPRPPGNKSACGVAPFCGGRRFRPPGAVAPFARAFFCRIFQDGAAVSSVPCDDSDGEPERLIHRQAAANGAQRTATAAARPWRTRPVGDGPSDWDSRSDGPP